jgi:Protein of unknown function (DUF2721)
MQANLTQGATQAAMGTMAAIAAAVTPVVMISANAILIGAISSKHQAMSDRVRTLAAEWRSPETSAVRRDSIRAQIRLFVPRIAWISRAHFLLYVATACFIAMVLVIALTPVSSALGLLSLPLLLCGVLLMLMAILLELLDLRKARATMEIESREVTGASISQK